VTYTVEEKAADGFTTEKTGYTGTISKDEAVKAEFTNTRETGDLIVSKSVKSEIDADKTVEFEFTVTLDDTTINGTYGEMTFENGVAKFVLKDGDSKKAEGLPTTLKYTVEEVDSKGFQVTTSGATGEISTEPTEAVITNTRALQDLSVRKIWIDNNNAQGLRPTVIKAYLYANGKWLVSVTLNAANGWDRTVKNLPVYDENGEKIRYTWREQNIPGYTLIQNYTVGNLTTFVNAIDEYGTPLGLGEVFINVGDCFE